MANPLDWVARQILQINGMSPEEIKTRARRLKAGRGKKPMPKANTKAPQPKPNVKAPKPGSIQAKGQTNLFNSKGQPRDFRNPKVSANRPPTTTPINHKPSQQLNPGPRRPPSSNPAQGELFGKNPNAKPGGNYRAPDVPKPGTATKPPPPPKPPARPAGTTVKGPVAPKSNAAVRLPNSAAQGKNLIKEGASNLRQATQGPTLKGSASAASRLASNVRAAGTAAGVAAIPVIAAKGLHDSIKITKEDQAKRNAAIAKAQADRKAKEQRDAKVRAEQSRKRAEDGSWNNTPSIVPTKKKK